MAKKIVLYRIKVPVGKYCWEHLSPYEICEYYDNEGGYSTCDLGFRELNDTDKGVLKPQECLKLQNVNKQQS